jgi:hypothetical protein
LPSKFTMSCPRFSVGFINPNEPVNCIDFAQTTVKLGHHLKKINDNPKWHTLVK